MKKIFLLFCFFVLAKLASAQKIDSIFFHLYTDSLKKGFYNYINVDGKTADGRWLPLTSEHLTFVIDKDSSLRFQANDLFIDSTYKRETVKVKAVLKSNPAVWKEAVIYIRKRGFDEPLKTDAEMLGELNRQPTKKKKSN